MPYPSDKWTDKELESLEKRIAEVYKAAEKDLDKEVKEYFAKFKIRDKQMQELVNAGEMTQAEYQRWRMTQMGRGQRFEALRDKVAERYTKANEVANAYVNDITPSIYSLNRNYEAYTIERTVGSCDFTMWDESTVRKLLVEQPDLMPYYPPSRALNRGIDLAYGKSQITKHVTSGIIRGLPPGKIANELMANITTMSRESAVRAARTGITAAQNAGRMDSYVAAEKMGITIRRKWICTKDSRTREAHGMADGQIVVGTKTPFIVGGEKMMFPCDKSMGAHGWNIYNCRCTTRTVEKDGIEAEPRQMRVKNPKWEEAKAEEDKLAENVEKLKELEQAETDPEKKKQLRLERIKGQEKLSGATQKRQGIDKNVVVNEMNYSEWKNWKMGLENSGNRIYNASENDIQSLSLRFMSNRDIMYRNLQSVPPLDGYEDVACHADPLNFSFVDPEAEETVQNVGARFLANRIKESGKYNGGAIRLIACEAGKLDDGIAQDFANEMGVSVLAPTKIVFVDSQGFMVLADDDIEAMKQFSKANEKWNPDGWRVFEPKEG